VQPVREAFDQGHDVESMSPAAGDAGETAARDAARDRLRERIRAFLAETAPDPADLRGAARELDLLPLAPDQVAVGPTMEDRERWFGVRPDGKVLSFATRAPRDPRSPESRWRHDWVLARERERYPELDAFIPPPPRDAPLCPRCDGAGRIRLGVSGRIVTCVCGGLGWIPPLDDEPLRREGR
jgi:hypothetical protein